MKLGARTRRIMLWSATSITALLAVAWIGSVWGEFHWNVPEGGFVTIQHGRFITGVPIFVDQELTLGDIWVYRTPAKMEWGFARVHGNRGTYTSIPLWAPLVIFAAVTAFAWRKETLARRRAKQHRCPSCGYDQSGLTPNTPCPECGKRVQGN